MHRLVCRCVGLSSALWKNSGSDLDAIWHHRSDGSRDEAGSGVWGSFHGKGTIGANLRSAIVTNGDFMAYVCDSALTVRAAVWVGACSGPKHCCIRWEVHVVQGEGDGLGFLFPIVTVGNAIGSPTMKCFRFVCENLTTFTVGKCIAGKFDLWAFRRYIQFEDQSWGLREIAKM